MDNRRPIRRKRPTPRRSWLRTDDHNQPWRDVRAAIWARSRGRCEICSRPLIAAFEAHHRLTRRFGPDCPCNALALCRDCHHISVHGHPEKARHRGWIVPRTSILAPATVPVRLAGRGWVLLSCDGTLDSTPEPVTPSPEVGAAETPRTEEKTR